MLGMIPDWSFLEKPKLEEYSMKARLAMTRDVVCIDVSETLANAHEIMTEWEIRHLPVMNGDKLVGILSDRDVLIYSTPGPNGLTVPELPVATAMTPNPITCEAGSEVTFIAETMLDHKIDSVPVVDSHNQLIGLVTSSDLISILLEREQPACIRTIPFQYKVHVNVKPRQTSSRPLWMS